MKLKSLIWLPLLICMAIRLWAAPGGNPNPIGNGILTSDFNLNGHKETNGDYYGDFFGNGLGLDINAMPVFYVENYGPVDATGAVSVDLAVSNAIGAASAAGGGIVALPTGTSLLDYPLVIPYNTDSLPYYIQPTIILQGVGSDNFQDAVGFGSRLMFSSTNNAAQWTNGYCISSFGSGQFQIRDCVVGEPVTGMNLIFIGTTQFHARNVQFMGNTNYPSLAAITLGGYGQQQGQSISTNQSFSGYISTVDTCKFYHCVGIVGGTYGGNGTVVVDNYFASGVGYAAMNFTGGNGGASTIYQGNQGLWIEGNTIELGNFTYAINLDNASYNEIGYNTGQDQSATNLAMIRFGPSTILNAETWDSYPGRGYIGSAYPIVLDLNTNTATNLFNTTDNTQGRSFLDVTGNFVTGSNAFTGLTNAAKYFSTGIGLFTGAGLTSAGGNNFDLNSGTGNVTAANIVDRVPGTHIISSFSNAFFWGLLSASNGFLQQVIITNGTYSVAISNSFVEEVASTNTEVILPPVSIAQAGFTVSINNAGTGTCTVTNATGSQLINGKVAYTNSTQYSTIFLISDGANWLNFAPLGGGGGGGSGTVTSVSGDGTVTSGTITTSGSLGLVNAAANSVLAGPTSGGASAPSYQTAPTISAANMFSFPASLATVTEVNQNGQTATNVFETIAAAVTLSNNLAAATQPTNLTLTQIAAQIATVLNLGSATNLPVTGIQTNGVTAGQLFAQTNTGSGLGLMRIDNLFETIASAAASFLPITAGTGNQETLVGTTLNGIGTNSQTSVTNTPAVIITYGGNWTNYLTNATGVSLTIIAGNSFTSGSSGSTNQGNISIGGNVTAGTFNGNGAGITNVQHAMTGIPGSYNTGFGVIATGTFMAPGPYPAGGAGLGREVFQFPFAVVITNFSAWILPGTAAQGVNTNITLTVMTNGNQGIPVQSAMACTINGTSATSGYSWASDTTHGYALPAGSYITVSNSITVPSGTAQITSAAEGFTIGYYANQ